MLLTNNLYVWLQCDDVNYRLYVKHSNSQMCNIEFLETMHYILHYLYLNNVQFAHSIPYIQCFVLQVRLFGCKVCLRQSRRHSNRFVVRNGFSLKKN